MIHSRTVFVSPAAKAILANIAHRGVIRKDGSIGISNLRDFSPEEIKVLQNTPMIKCYTLDERVSYNVMVDAKLVQQLGLRSCAKEQ